MAKQNAVWGIDIGQCALKALRCTLGDDGETIVADKYDFIEYPKILNSPDSEPEEMIREALEQFLSRNDVVGDRVAISVSGQAGLSRFFKPPPVEVKMLPDIVKYEVKQQIPFPIEDVIWDWQQLGGTVVDGRAIDAEVGLFAMKRESVSRALQPFDEIGVEIDVVQLSPLSIFNVICFDQIDELPDPEEFDPENPPESIVVMSMGTDTTDLIVTNGIKLWLRNIPIGGNHFTKQLSREMKLTQAKAEHLKRNARVSENPKAIFKAMRSVFNDLVNEVQRSLTFFQSMEKSAELKEIVLLGNAAKLPGLRQFLSKQLEIDIAKVSEFNKLKGSDVVSQPTFSNNLLSFAPCYGLCIQGLKKGQINTNLLPQDIVVERIIRAKKPWVLASVGALTLGLVLGYFFHANAWWRVNPEYSDAANVTWNSAVKKVSERDSTSKRYLANDADLKLQLDKFNAIAKELTSASEKKATWIELYSALSQAFPQDPRIKAVKEQGIDRVDPTEIDFKDRKELYIDHVESKYFKNLQVWLNDVQAIHEKMGQLSEEEIAEAKMAGATDEFVQDVIEEDAAVDAAAATTEFQNPWDAFETGVDTSLEDPNMQGELGGIPGWVIEIKGHHFHNSDEELANLNTGRTYLYQEFIRPLLEKEDVVIPTNDADDLFSYSDIGISFPTITTSVPRERKTIVFDPTATDPSTAVVSGGAGGKGGMAGGKGGMTGGAMGRGGMGAKGGMAGGAMGAPAGPPGGGGIGGLGGTAGPDPNAFQVYEYKFVVQMAWMPRSEKERLEARAARRAAAAEAKAAADAAAAEEGDPIQ